MAPPTLIEIRDEIRSGGATSRQWVERTLKQIETTDPKVHALIGSDGDRALALADRIDEKIAGGESVGELAGVPILIKDNLCTSFGRTTCSSKILENFRAPFDAHVVEKLQAA
ncbi:MAG: amidase family protein, partial [Planctomycetota bacterium]